MFTKPAEQRALKPDGERQRQERSTPERMRSARVVLPASRDARRRDEQLQLQLQLQLPSHRAASPLVGVGGGGGGGAKDKSW